jgi:hypothetical protein
MKSSDDELLAAYLDGVAELTPEERQRVEARLPELDVDGTRQMIDQLRALPAEGSEPDWRALERRIAGAVDAAKPPWWRRWLVIAPVGALGALAVAAAALLWLHHAPDEAKPAPLAVTTPAHPEHHDAAPVPPPAPAESNEVWIDGKFVDVSDVDPDLLLDDTDEPAADVADEDALLPASDLGWVDQLDDRALDRAEHWLERKKS